MSPLRDTVGLVDSEQADIHIPEVVDFEQKTFGRNIEQLNLTTVCGVEYAPVCGIVLVRMYCRRRYAVGNQPPKSDPA